MDIPHLGEDKRILGPPLYGKQTPSRVLSIRFEDPQSYSNPSECNQFMLFICRNWMGLQCKEAAWFPQLAPKSGSHVEGVQGDGGELQMEDSDRPLSRRPKSSQASRALDVSVRL